MEHFNAMRESRVISDELQAARAVAETLRAEGYEFSYDDTSHKSEVLITHVVKGKERTTHVTVLNVDVDTFVDLVRKTIQESSKHTVSAHGSPEL